MKFYLDIKDLVAAKDLAAAFRELATVALEPRFAATKEDREVLSSLGIVLDEEGDNP